MNTPEDGHVLTTVGLDLGDKTIQACFVDHHGEIVEESRLKSTDAALRRRFSGVHGVERQVIPHSEAL